jgi:hypothetical protein
MTTFWVNDINILFNKQSLTEIWPLPTMSNEEKLNAITRLVLVLTVLGYLLTGNGKIILSAVITIACIVFLYKTQKSKAHEIKLQNTNIKEAFTNPDVYNYNKDKFTKPTANNPMMNVLLTDYTDNPNRKQAAPCYNLEVENDLNKKTKDIDNKFNGVNDESEKINKKLFKDLGEAIDFEDSMRIWNTNPSTTIPNDQEAFAQFCFGSMRSCKTGDTYACSQQMPSLQVRGGGSY